MGHEFVLCRRDSSETGAEPKFCARPISKPNDLNWCAECRKRLPLWPDNLTHDQHQTQEAK
jgi:hypothetical protein